eukprot:scaffold2611_cov214-Pinguiococcus_pyrenoidosus.AAC.3
MTLETRLTQTKPNIPRSPLERMGISASLFCEASIGFVFPSAARKDVALCVRHPSHEHRRTASHGRGCRRIFAKDRRVRCFQHSFDLLVVLMPKRLDDALDLNVLNRSCEPSSLMVDVFDACAHFAELAGELRYASWTVRDRGHKAHQSAISSKPAINDAS